MSKTPLCLIILSLFYNIRSSCRFIFTFTIDNTSKQQLVNSINKTIPPYYIILQCIAPYLFRKSIVKFYYIYMYEIAVHSFSFYETHDVFHCQNIYSQQISILQIYETVQLHMVPPSITKDNHIKSLFYNVQKSPVTHG